MRPLGPNIGRPRSEGAEYFIVIDLPPMVAEAVAEGLCGFPAKDNAAEASNAAGIRMDLLMNRVYPLLISSEAQPPGPGSKSHARI